MTSRRVKPQPANSSEATAWYARLSRYVPDQTSTERQLADEKKFSELYGLPPAREYVDIDVSAYGQVFRPAYERMLSDIKAGAISHVVIWKIDRIARNLTEFMRFQNLCDTHGVVVKSVNDPYDTSTPIGRAIVQILAVFAELESATIGVRVRSAKDLAAERGRYAGGGFRPFGLSNDRSVLVDDEAAAIQAAAQRVLEGESYSTIVREWRAAGLKTPRGGEWTVRVLSRTLRSPHLAGLRVHQGAVVGDSAWPAILDRVTHERLVALGKKRTRVPARRAHLLTGLLACGRCGARLGTTRNDGILYYTCPPKNVGGCRGVSIMAEPTDVYVKAATLGGLAAPEVRSALTHPKNGGENETQILDALRAAEGRLMELGEQYALGVLPMPAFRSATAVLEERIGELERRLGRAAEANRVVLVGPDPEAEWAKRDLTWRAALVAALFETPIVVVPGRAPASDRVRLIPRP